MEGHLTRTTAYILLGSLLGATACVPPELDERISGLEAKVKELEDKVAKAPAAAANPGAPQVDEAAEKAGAELLKAATKLSEEMKYDDAKAKVKELKDKHPNTRAARAAQRLEAELEIIGKPSGDLQVEKWFKGELASLDEGQATLLVFWEIWCPHCKREVPKLSATYEKYNSKGLNMVGLTKINRSATEEQVVAFVKESNVAYPVAKEQGDAMSKHFGVRGIPAAAVVKNGKVVWRGHPARITDTMIDSWIGS
jgi:thiol-disulfide isomerase/thioredoxin